MKRLVFLLLIFLLANSVFGQNEVNKVGTAAANFMDLEVGARAVAMAGAYTALSSDATALKWNPAGLTSVNSLTVTYSNVNLYADIQQQFTGLVVPLGFDNALGFSVNYVDVGKIEQTTVESPEGTGLMFSNYNMAVGVSFARNLTDRISFGTTVWWVHEQIWEEKADGFCADIGVIFTPGISGLRLGMSITSFGPDMAMDQGPLKTFWDEPEDDRPGVGNRTLDSQLLVEKYPMPVSFQTAAALDIMGANSFLVTSNSNRVTFALEINDAFDNAMRSKYGIEYEWNRIFALRAGYKNNYELAEFTFGGGIRIPVSGMNLKIDYAYADYQDLEEIHITTVELGF